MKKNFKKWIAVLTVLVLMASMFIGCAAKTEETPGEPATTEAAVETPTDTTLKVGIFNFDGKDSGGWTKAHWTGVEFMKAKYPNVEVVWVENVPDVGTDAPKVIDQLVEDGCNIVIGTSFGFLEAVNEGAAKYPDVKFYMCQGYKMADNEGVFDVKDYEAIFLTGYTSARMAKGDVLGYVAAQPVPTVLRAVNAFSLGAKYANPKATVKVIFTNNWYDPTKEKEAAFSLIDAGATALGMHASSPAVPQAATERGVYVVGFHEDMSAIAPDAMLTSFVWNFGPMYAHMAETYLDGTWKAEDLFWGLDKGCGGIAPLNTALVPADIVKDVEDLQAKLLSGEVKVFTGEIKDNQGTVRVKAGEEITLEQVKSFDWLVENVEGTIGK